MMGFFSLFLACCLASQPLPLSLLDLGRGEQVKEYAGKEVSVRGFLYRSEQGGWALAPEPDLKSCCVGKGERVGKQLFFDLPEGVGRESSLAEVKGVFQVEPKRGERGELIELYRLDNPRLLHMHDPETGLIWAAFLTAIAGLGLFRFLRSRGA